MFWLFACALAKVKDTDPLITQELVDRINNDPHSTFKATLYPEFAKMTVGEAKKFLSPVRKAPSGQPHGSPRPIGANENHFVTRDKRVLTGFYRTETDGNQDQNRKVTQKYTAANSYKYTVYDNKQYCSSWAAAVTSAMSLALSIHHGTFVNLSIQFILDCDLMGDPCVERPPLNAYEQFWRRYIPQQDRWDKPSNVLRTPYKTLTKAICDDKGDDANGCYPGWTSCPRNLVMTGSCEPGSDDSNCPIYFLYNWRWIKSHLWEVGPVTSSILVRNAFFSYASGVYSSLSTTGTNPSVMGSVTPSGTLGEILGMLDVTIIGWGQHAVNLSRDASYHTGMYNRWWYVIPHLGADWGESCDSIFGNIAESKGGAIETDEVASSIASIVQCPGSVNGHTSGKSGIVRFNRRFDDSNIESQAVGAVPYNFKPMAYRTPKVKKSN